MNQPLTPEQQKQIKKIKAKMWIGLISIIVVGLAVAVYFIFLNPIDREDDTGTVISNFEECVNAGYPVMESYPRQCAVNGVTYVETIINQNLNVNNQNTNTNLLSDETKLQIATYTDQSCETDADCGIFPCVNNECLIKECTCSCNCSGNICGGEDSEAPGYCLSSTASGTTEIDTSDWLTYENDELGFSIKYPTEILDEYGSCELNSDESQSVSGSDHSYRAKEAVVPVKVFESGNTVYISTEYYYQLTEETKEIVDGGSRSFFAGCEKVDNSIDLLSDQNNHYEYAWELEITRVKNENDIEQAIKNRYGTSCILEEKTKSEFQEGVYDLHIYRPGVANMDPGCPVNFPTVLKYYPAKGLVITWNTGQSSTFIKSHEPSVDYDQEMIDSFRFI